MPAAVAPLSEVRLAPASGAPELAVRYDTSACQGGSPNQLFIDVLANGARTASFSVSAQGAPAACDERGRVFEQGDFNFDGHADLAVAVDNTGPYGGPTYEILLFRSDTGRYDRAPALSALTRDYLGLFRADAKRQRLVASSKSGCCSHSTTELRVSSSGEPVIIQSTTIAHQAEGCSVTTERTGPAGGTSSSTRRCTRDER